MSVKTVPRSKFRVPGLARFTTGFSLTLNLELLNLKRRAAADLKNA